MKRYVLWAVMAAFLLAGPIGCGKKEIEALTVKVTQLEKDLAAANSMLAEKDKEAADARAENERCGAEKSKIQAERDKLKQELGAFKKKARSKTTRTKTKR